MTQEELRDEALRKAVYDLGEFFDHVQIMVTTNTSGRTERFFVGVGNWYARQGLAHELINRDIAVENAVQIADAISDKGEE